MFPQDGTPRLDRRELLRAAILLAGGSLAGLPGQALAQAAASGAPAARFFTAAQFAALAEIADTIIPRTDTPGAKDAGVPEALDSLMTHWASKKRQSEFRELVDEIDRRAVAAGGKPLPALAPAQRVEVVRAFDAERMGAGDGVYGKFKELLLTLYYLSEAGATKELRYELIPGKFEPWTEMAPDTRAWAV